MRYWRRRITSPKRRRVPSSSSSSSSCSPAGSPTPRHSIVSGKRKFSEVEECGNRDKKIRCHSNNELGVGESVEPVYVPQSFAVSESSDSDSSDLQSIQEPEDPETINDSNIPVYVPQTFAVSESSILVHLSLKDVDVRKMI